MITTINSSLVNVVLSTKKFFNFYLTVTSFLVQQILGFKSVGPSSGSLQVIDSRTKRTYTIPIVHNAVRATDFRMISAAGLGADPVDQVEGGLRIIDKGFLNTACMESNITLM